MSFASSAAAHRRAARRNRPGARPSPNNENDTLPRHGFHVDGPHDHALEHAAQHGDMGSSAGMLAVVTAVLATIGDNFSDLGAPRRPRAASSPGRTGPGAGGRRPQAGLHGRDRALPDGTGRHQGRRGRHMDPGVPVARTCFQQAQTVAAALAAPVHQDRAGCTAADDHAVEGTRLGSNRQTPRSLNTSRAVRKLSMAAGTPQ